MSPVANGLQPLSCLQCAHRTVRSDRLNPCSKCTNHDVLCEFPPPKTEKRKRRKTPVASSSSNKLRARLDRYEEMLKDVGVDVESISNSPRGAADSPKRDDAPRQETINCAARPTLPSPTFYKRQVTPPPAKYIPRMYL